jgi:hypothetical protein
MLANVAGYRADSALPPPLNVNKVIGFVQDIFATQSYKTLEEFKSYGNVRSQLIDELQKSAHDSNLSSAGRNFVNSIKTLRAIGDFSPKSRPLPILDGLAEKLSIEFVRAVNALADTVHRGFQVSDECGYMIIGAAALLNPWEFEKLELLFTASERD